MHLQSVFCNSLSICNPQSICNLQSANHPQTGNIAVLLLNCSVQYGKFAFAVCGLRLRLRFPNILFFSLKIQGSRARKRKNAADFKHFWPFLAVWAKNTGSLDPCLKKHWLALKNELENQSIYFLPNV